MSCDDDLFEVCRLADRLERHQESPYRSSAVRVTNGDVFEGAHHAEAFERARDAGHVPPEKAFDSGAWKTGFVTHAGEFHSYFDAMRARATDRHAMNGQSAVCDKRVWRPQDEEEELEKHPVDNGFGGWLSAVRFPDGATFADASHRKAWKKAEAEGRPWSDDAEEGFVDPTGPFLSRAEFHERTGILPKSGELRDLGWIDKHWDGSHTIREDHGDDGSLDRHMGVVADWSEGGRNENGEPIAFDESQFKADPAVRPFAGRLYRGALLQSPPQEGAVHSWGRLVSASRSRRVPFEDDFVHSGMAERGGHPSFWEIDDAEGHDISNHPEHSEPDQREVVLPKDHRLFVNSVRWRGSNVPGTGDGYWHVNARQLRPGEYGQSETRSLYAELEAIARIEVGGT